ncbi:MAG TPA: bifunctional oligoribonuclease/PAP phosphatase NrnA [Verrucomicrobiae bacterium]|nr:bifunctional oligoribonuclease/PAP phosphatase NrnA [Verrucomicrobiae bacterium]
MTAKIIEAIGSANSFLITAHENPDGDAVGSSLALANFLAEQGKDVTVYFADPLPEIYFFLPLADTVVAQIPDRHFDICFVLDVGEFRRAGSALPKASIGSFINIDHHLTCEPFGAINLIDVNASATGALIHRVVKESGRAISYEVALCIYVAVISDTGSFRYSNSDPEAFAIAGEMIAAGVNAWYVAEHLYESQPPERLKLLGAALETLDFSPRGDFASITVTLDMYRETGGSAELTDGFINYPRSIRGVEVAVFFRQLRPGLYKVGFRSKGKINVAALAERFGGGGHHNAAGGTVEGEIDEVKGLVFPHLEKALA